MHYLHILRTTILVLVALFACSACDSTPEPEVKPPTIFNTPAAAPPVREAIQEEPDENFPTNDQAWFAAVGLPWQVGYVQYVNGQRVGVSVVDVTASTLVNGQILVNRRDVLETRRDGKVLPVEIRIEAVEREGGRMGNFTLTTSRGEDQTVVEGSLLKNRLSLTTLDPQGEKTQQSLAYGEETWGIMGIQAILMHTPMQAGERRTSTAFIPGLNTVAPVVLTAGNVEPTPLVAGTTLDLLPIDVTLQTQDNPSRARYWVDDLGVIEKTLTLSGPSMVTFRVPIETTQRVEAEIQLAQWKDKVIALEGDFADAVGDGTVVYQVNASSKPDPFFLFSQNAYQRVQSIDPVIAEITVSQAGEFPVEDEDQPGDAERLPGALVQSEEEAIDAMALEFVGDAEDPEAVATKLAEGVFGNIQPAPWTSEIASAVDTARSGKGDFLDRAVLLTALLRNRGIPARLVLGMRLTETPPDSFMIHAWTEAWLDERWSAFDPSRGSPIDAGYLRMQSSALDEPNPTVALLPTFESTQRLQKIRFVDTE